MKVSFESGFGRLTLLFALTLGGTGWPSENLGVSDTAVRMGQSAAFSGASASLGIELWRGAHAYFSEVNEQGGIHGRKIEVITIDDAYDGDRALANTIRLASQENIFGLFGYVGTPTIVRALPALMKFSGAGLFLFSNFTGAQPQRELPYLPYVFNVRSSYRQETAAQIEIFTGRLGFTKIGLFIQADAYGRSGADGTSRALARNGLKPVVEVTYRRGTKFSDPLVEQARILIASGAEAVVSIGSYEACAALVRDARDAGFKGPIGNVSFVGADNMLALINALERKTGKSYSDKLLNTQVVPPWNDTTYPLVVDYQKLMSKFGPTAPAGFDAGGLDSKRLGFGSLEGFLNARLLVEILKRIPRNRLTRSEFTRTANHLSTLDVGLRANLAFDELKHQASSAVYFTTASQGQFVEVKEWGRFR